jgi:hypothetical protein
LRTKYLEEEYLEYDNDVTRELRERIVKTLFSMDRGRMRWVEQQIVSHSSHYIRTYSLFQRLIIVDVLGSKSF